MKRRPTDSNTEGKKDTGMLKYIRNQVRIVIINPKNMGLIVNPASFSLKEWSYLVIFCQFKNSVDWSF